MLLESNKSLCEIRAKIIVSKDRGTSRKHILNNNNRKKVRQYQLDGNIIKNEKSCDFLVLNDDDKKAFFIELKGCNINEAIPQFEGAVKKLEAELNGYIYSFRVISSKNNTHNLNNSRFLKFKRKYNDILTRTNEFSEKID